MALFEEKKTHNSKEVPKNGKILLVDADTVCFHSILQCTSEEILMDRHFYSDEAWDILINEEGFNEHTNTCRHLNFDQAKKAFDYKIESLLMATGCETAKIYVTGWLPTFRHYLDPKYKSDRKGGQRPLRLSEFKWWLVQEREAHISGYFEADELLARAYLDDMENTMLASVDKDLLLQLSGTHFDYYSQRFHLATTSEADAVYNFHYRLLTGDRGDYILTGLIRVGEKTAIKILHGVKTKFDTMMRLKGEKPNEEELEEYRWNLYASVRKEYLRQGCGDLLLMWNMVGADYYINGGFIPTTPKTPDNNCPFCYAKKADGLDQCGKHELRDVPEKMSMFFAPEEDTHLIEDFGEKQKQILRLYQEMHTLFSGNIADDLNDIERFALFVTMKVKKLSEVTVVRPVTNKPISEHNIWFKEIS